MDSTLAQPAVPAPRRNWWQRNWKWFVPTGCLTLLLLAASFVALIVVVAFSAMKTSDAYRLALDRAKADSRVQAALGRPIQEGFFPTGSTNVNNGSGSADLAIPISGPKGKGTLYAVGTKRSGRWRFTRLLVQVERSGERIPLVAPGNDETEP